MKKSNYAGGLSNPSTPPTIGSSGAPIPQGRQGKYSRFDDTGMYPLEAVVDIETGTRSRRAEDSGFDGDGGSEKAIVMSRTATVVYSNRGSNRG